MLGLFQKYPVLARLMATQIDFWIEAKAEFLQRSRTDLFEIGQTFRSPVTKNSKTDEKNQFAKIQLGKVIEIEPNLSDPHNRGRRAIALTFESGLKLIYKPKDLSLEVVFNQILDWCNRQDIPLSFKTLKVLDRHGYGWVEYVEQLPLKNEEEAQRFYQRAGMLLCLLYVLGATDCHCENLIASGEHLVLVDLETLMQHQVKPIKDFSEQQQPTIANRKLTSSVLFTGLLPRWTFNKDNRLAWDISGLGSIDPQPSSWRTFKWQFINTDNMYQVEQIVNIAVKKNVPILNGIALSPNDYLQELVKGFEQMYRFLLEHRQKLLTSKIDSSQNSVSPLLALAQGQVRFFFRTTKVYGAILQNSLAPEFLKNGVDRSIELELLTRAFLVSENKPDAWSILHSELRAMEQLDIPFFAANSNSDALTVGVDRSIEQYFKEPSYSQVISRLQRLDETDLARQVAIIRGAFYARVARSSSTNTSSQQNLSVWAIELSSKQTPATKEKLLASACAIAEQINFHAIEEADGSVSWLGLDYIPSADLFQFQPLGHSLYNGNCGIALFLAALDYLKGDKKFRDLTLGALQSLREVLQTAETLDILSAQKLAEGIGLGGASGLGSIVYTLVKIGHFLKEPKLIADARRAANLITPELIATDQYLDILGGSAGAILGLLALYNETSDRAVLDKAVACGRHLLERQISVDGLPRAWKTLEDKPLTGFSHGAAGITYALLRLYAVTSNNAYLDAAKEGIAYERSVFSTKAANYPDFRSFAQQSSQPGFMVSWCHGAPGITLGRLGSLSVLDTDEIHQEIEVALQTTQNYSLQGVDHLCCGNFGRIEVLLMAAQKLSRPELLEIAQQPAAWLVAKAEETGGYQLFSNLPNSVFNFSFFQGTTGIGYGLLRLAYPEILPSVLLLA